MNSELFAELVRQCQAGDREALEQLLTMAYTPVAYLCAKLLRNDQGARSLTREILKSIPQKLETLEDPERFEKWLCRSTASRCMRELEAMHAIDPEQTQSDCQPEKVKIPAKHLDEDQTALAVSQMVDDLPEESRVCLILYGCGRVSPRGISRMIRVPEETVTEWLRSGQALVNIQLRKFHKMGIRFAAITSLPELLCTAMYNSEAPRGADALIQSILEPKPAPPKVRKPKTAAVSKPLLAAVVIAALLLVLMLTAIVILESRR